MSAVRSIARIAYEVNRAYCDFLGDVTVPAGAPWDELDVPAQRRLYIGVRLQLEKPEITAEESHEAWLEARLNDGWVYGETKDEQLRRHPCMRPWSELPEGHRLKDRLFKAVCLAAKDRLEAQEASETRPTFYSSRDQRIGLAYAVARELSVDGWATDDDQDDLLDALALSLEPAPAEGEAPAAPDLTDHISPAWVDMFNLVYRGILVAHGIK